MFDALIDINDKKYLLITAGNPSDQDTHEQIRRIKRSQATAEPIQVFSLKSVPAKDAPDECEQFARLEYSFLYRNTKGWGYHPHINIEPGSIDVRLQAMLMCPPYPAIDGLLIDDGKAVLLSKDAVDALIAKPF